MKNYITKADRLFLFDLKEKICYNKTMEINEKFKNYSIERKINLIDEEINSAFEIVKKNVLDLGIEVSENDKQIWINSLTKNLKNNDFYFYLLMNKNEVVGFLELIEREGKLTLSEIQLNDKAKRTFILINALRFVLESADFNEFDEVYFSIKKENTASNQTFKHLGGKVVDDLGKNLLYRITRTDVEKYFQKLKNMIKNEGKMNFKGKVSASACDSEARLSVLGAICLVQDYVSEFYGENKIDQTSLRKRFDSMWVFTKTRLKFFRPVMWNEEFLVECYVTSLSSVKMVVETAFYVAGERVLVCQIENCMVERTTQKIRRLNDVFPENFEICNSVFEGNFERFEVKNYETKEEIQVRSTSIDYCHHTNNTEYVRFVLNSFSVSELTHLIKEFEIHYLAQTHEGDKLLLNKAEAENKVFVSLTNGEKLVSECKIVF